jgi:3-oxoacyl-[acyl-carrier protein] reductase
MEIDFSGKKVLVTGASRGIGDQLKKDFMKNGASEVWTTSRQAVRCMQHIKVDFLDEEQTEECLDTIKAVGFDILINNAGTNKIGPIEEYDIDDYKRIIELNLTSCFRTTQAVIPHMKKNGWGRIVNITSISSEISMPLRSAYCSSKFGLVGLTKVTAVELAQHGILVNSVGPGVTETELTVDVLGRDKMNEIAEANPAKRLGTVQDVSNVVLFMASPLNTYMVGQNVLVDGGYTCV